jgi:molecular chaperone DnaJ
LAPQKRDYYEVLGLDRTCTLEEIKKTYRILARKYHPDVNNGENESAEKFKEISEAYAILSNSEKRRQYDQFGFNGSLFDNFDSESTFSEFGFGDIFDMFFGTSFGRGTSQSRSSRRPSRGSDIEVELSIGFKDAAFGIDKEIEYLCNDLCDACYGTGSSSENGKAKCSNCNGTGQVRTTRQTFIGNIVTATTCNHCGGAGEIIKDPCKKCQGTGYYRKKKKTKIKVPAGIHDGDKLRIRDKGNTLGKGSISGDLIIHISIASHPIFRRSGNDVLSDAKISFAQAALGCKLEIETVDGNETLTIDPGTQPGKKIKLKSRGMVELNGFRRGDHIVHVDVLIPTKLTQEEVSLLKQYASGRQEDVGDGNASLFSNFKSAFRKN